MQQKKSWWTSEFNRMDGELDVPLPWWAEPRGAAAMDYGEMKVGGWLIDVGGGRCYFDLPVQRLICPRTPMVRLSLPKLRCRT